MSVLIDYMCVLNIYMSVLIDCMCVLNGYMSVSNRYMSVFMETQTVKPCKVLPNRLCRRWPSVAGVY